MRAVLLVISLSSLLACGDDGGAAPDASDQNCATDTRAPEFTMGLAATGDNGYTVTIDEATPFPAERGDNDWTVSITDGVSASAGGLTIAVDPRMPDHGHGTPVIAGVTETATAGTYEVTPINLWMPGYWEITMTLSDGGIAPLDTVMLAVCVDP